MKDINSSQRTSSGDLMQRASSASVCTKARSESESLGPTGINALCAGCDTGSCLMQHTFCLIQNLKGNRWFQTAFRCANYIMLLLIDISSAFDRSIFSVNY